MAMPFPYTYYTCPCSTIVANESFASIGNRQPLRLPNASPHKRTTSTSPTKRAAVAAASPPSVVAPEAGNESDEPFNPHDACANYSLYTLDNLLFCDECNQIRCPKCWLEEVINWYCPSCLFEVPSSVVRGDGNRCSRNCYQCPVCTAPLSVTGFDPKKSGQGEGNAAAPHNDEKGLLKPPESEAKNDGPESYILQCLHCDWSSMQLDVQLSRQTKVTEQLNKLRKDRRQLQRKQYTEDSPEGGQVQRDSHQHPDHDTAFESLQKFYRTQLDEANDGVNTYASSPYSSPANLARIMSMYGGLNHTSLKKSREKPQPMREALTSTEGLVAHTTDNEFADEEVMEKMRMLGWEATAARSQRDAPVNHDVRFVDELWPVAVRLKVRRGKRCQTCRQFLARPEPKVSSFRYKIRLLALHHIPRLSIRPLNATATQPQVSSFALKSETAAETKLQPRVPQQFVLTLRNPIFETVKITLATPAVTPGRVASRVTVLCPTFTIGPAGDVWDDALSVSDSTRPTDGGRKAAMASLTGSTDGDRQPEAGKVWERTRNSTSVILEVVPGSVPYNAQSAALQATEDEAGEDDDVLEVPIFVRAEWEAEVHAQAERDTKGREKEAKEVAYWCVLGVGRIAA